MPSLSGLTNPGSKVLSPSHPMHSAAGTRAMYCIPSRNDNNGWFGGVFFDAELNLNHYSTQQNYYGTGGQFYQNPSTYQSTDQMFPGVGNSAGTQSSSSTPYLSGLWNGQYGCMITKPLSRGIVSGLASTWPTNDVSEFMREAYCYVNSDHQRRDITVQLRNGILTASPIMKPFSGHWPENILPESMRKYKSIVSFFPSGTAITTMYGSGSYNAVRKELVVMAHNTNGSGQFDIALWTGVDWNANDCDVTALGAPNNLYNFTSPNWNSNNEESRYNVKPILVDNGDLYYSVWFYNDNFSLYKVTRNTASTTTPWTAQARMDANGTTTSYGRDQGTQFGQRIISTRIGNMVAVSTPYYYYGAGLRNYVIDKRNSSWARGPDSNDTTYGMNCLKYKDDCFIYVTGANYYAGNWSSMSDYCFMSPRTGSTPGINRIGFYTPLAPGPNTTNYIGMFNVFDYDIQTHPTNYSGGKRS